RAFWLPGFGPTKALPGGGLRINAPFISPGDYFVGEVNYSHGAIRYNVNSASPNQTIVEGGNEAFGIASDCVYGGTVAAGTATGCQLTSAWNFNVGYDHYWTPSGTSRWPATIGTLCTAAQPITCSAAAKVPVLDLAQPQ